MTGQSIVGRAELKLAEAAQAFHYDFRDKIVLDTGSSTGGFTEYALRHGARKVIAIEKGTHQMKAPLRYDSRISLHEKTDFLELIPFSVNKAAKLPEQQRENPLELVQNKQVAPPSHNNPLRQIQPSLDLRQVDTVLADVSFVSLTKILTQAQKLVPRSANYLVMLKPQFEAQPYQLVNGVVKNEKIRRQIIQHFERWLTQHGFVILKKRDNTTVGKRGGNKERFYLLRSSLSSQNRRRQ